MTNKDNVNSVVESKALNVFFFLINKQDDRRRKIDFSLFSSTSSPYLRLQALKIRENRGKRFFASTVANMVYRKGV